MSDPIIRTRKEALARIRKFRRLEKEIVDIEQEYGIGAKRREVADLKQSVIGYMKQSEKTRLDAEGGFVTLVEASSKSWISTKADIPPHAKHELGGRKYRSLRAILGKELWLSVTKRVIDPQKLNELVEEGHISEDKLASAMIETPHAAYIRFYEEGK